MRLTRAGEYAVRCILYLSASEEGAVANRKEIARAMEIPAQFLGKIAQGLARRGFIEIVQGARGGYRLLKKPREISLLDVVEATEGEIFLNDCVLRPGSCSMSPECSVNRVWILARDRLRETLAAADFESLTAEGACFPALETLKDSNAKPSGGA